MVLSSSFNRGVTIIELAISVVIIGLLLALISGGLYVLHSAELRRTINDFTSIDSAISEFKTKYSSLPGDFPNATTFWGAYTNGTPITGALNGDGNTLIDNDEDLYSWRHLSLSGIYPGQFTGAIAANTGRFVPSINAPASNVYTSALFRFYSTTTSIYNNRGHAVQLGIPDDNGLPNKGIAKPKDAYAIDSKLDDGNASSGIFVGLNSDTNCVDSTNQYALDSNQASCSLLYWQELF